MTYMLLMLLVSTVVSVMVMRWSNRRVLGIETSWRQSIFLVLARTTTATGAGFAIGYAIRLVSNPGDGLPLKLAGLVSVAGLALWVYWSVLGKVTQQPVPVMGVAKAWGLETLVVWSGVVLISFLISCFLFL